MATSSEDSDHREPPLSQPQTDETTIFYMEILTFDLVVNILCRLPVNILMKLRCVCKSLEFLNFDPTFAKEQLRFSRTLLNRHHLLLCRGDMHASEFLVWDSRLPFVFNSASTNFPETQLTYPLGGVFGDIIDTCDGIICFSNSIEDCFDSILVWSPSIRKFKILPPLEKNCRRNATYGFGYDCLTNSYKVVVLGCYEIDISNYVCKTQVMVHTLGTDTWKSIPSFPSALLGLPCNNSGKFVSGAISWLLFVALDLGNETSQELLLPNFGGADFLTLGVLRDCLCILAHTNAFVIHVWLMKDYGNKESWTQLFSLLYTGLFGSRSLNCKALAFAHLYFRG